MLLPNVRKNRFSPVFVFSALVIIFVGGASAWYVHENVDTAGRAHILDRAETMAVLIPAHHIPLLTGSDADIGTTTYEEMKRELMEARASNDDIRFVYLMGAREGEVFFYADSERPLSEDYSPPGQPYEEVTDDMWAVFEDGMARVEGPERDRWGTWISAYAPVTDANGRVVALLGIDLPADVFLRDLYVYTVLPLLIAFSLLLFVIAGEISRRREQKVIEEKEEFLSIASHEIRTPLTGVRWGLEQLSRNAEQLSEGNKNLVSLMHQTSVTLVARLNTLLDMHSFEHGKERAFTKDVIYIEAFMKEAASTLMLAAKERGITLNLPASGEATLKADSQLLRHVFQNLIGNAIKYTKPNTAVTVSYEKEKNFHTFRFKDDGEGIPEDEKEFIFSGFHRGARARKSATSGTGLGLYMARKAVLMHGGTISFVSEKGKGTEFTVRIPE